MGEGWAKRMILCGERVNAETALKIGLIEEIVAPGDSKAQAIALAARVARQSPSSVTACKKAHHGGPWQPYAARFAKRTGILRRSV